MVWWLLLLLLPRLLLLLLLLEVAAAGCRLRHDDDGRSRRTASAVRQREPRSECHYSSAGGSRTIEVVNNVRQLHDRVAARVQRA